MDTNFYRQIIMDAPFGYVHYKAMRGSDGLVADYVFIEGNKVFELFTGRKSADTIGQSMEKILSQWDMNGDWINSFRSLNRQGAEKINNVEFYAQAFQRWFSVQVNNLQPDYFTAIFTDITQSKKNEQRVRHANQRVERQRAATAQMLLFDLASLPIDTAQKDISQYLVRLLSETIETARASLWMFNADKSEAHCMALYQADNQEVSSGAVLHRRDFPHYFDVMCTDTRIDASDAQNDPRTSEFTDIYLRPLGITAMLDAGILVNGEIVGLICLEHVGKTRPWMVDEEAFASTMAAIYAQILIGIQQNKAQAELEASQSQVAELAKQQILEQELRSQQERLLSEISTPITQLWDNILLLPLVGGMSARRAQDILSTTLRKITETQAKVFVLDIGGVSHVDTAVANGFIRLAKATRLMGCHCIISGISPAIAQTITELGIQTDELHTTGLMRDALVQALYRTNLKISNL